MKYDLKQESFASTLMSSLKVAYDFYHNDELTDSMMFGISGHAFVTHITNGLGPCAPYTFDMRVFKELCKNGLGLVVFENDSFVSLEDDLKKKKEVSDSIMKTLDNGSLPLLVSYEYQVFSGYDDSVLYLTKPWKEVESVTNDLKINSLEGMKEFFGISEISKNKKVDLKEAISNSIKYAISLFEVPSEMIDSGYGLEAYDFWLEKINEENATGHGNWWTSSVWAESRRMAANYMLEIKAFFKKDEVLESLNKIYIESSKLFEEISNRDLGMKDKVKLINELKENELKTVGLLKELL